MVKYLIIQLDDTSTSFCHYRNTRSEKKLIPLEMLDKAIMWGLKENVIFQFLFPSYDLPAAYTELINSVYHASIVPSGCNLNPILRPDVTVISGVGNIEPKNCVKDTPYVVRDSFNNLVSSVGIIQKLIMVSDRVTIIPTDIEDYTDSFNDTYEKFLSAIASCVRDQYIAGHYPQINLITDRIVLDKMNNCNAGCESVTICPDGKFYICPAFYLDKDGYAVGNLDNGLDIKNRHLYNIEYAPICRVCDCWQCKRCIWLNRKLTLEVNTPGHQQCVIAHLERNASRKFLNDIRSAGEFMPGKDIPEIDYMDPFNLIKQ